MRCPHCGAENPDGTSLCQGCRAALCPCPSCGFGNPSGFRFCGGCGAPLASATGTPARRDYTPHHLADKILSSRAALEGERKQVTVLFADIKGSQALAASVDAEDWHAILDSTFAILTEGVHRFEGTVNQYTGDGIMALFGAPIAHEDHAQRACLAALSMREALARHSAELEKSRGFPLLLRMGLNSGEVVVGKIGDDLRMDYTAQGETVGLAARMEQLAEPGRIYLTEQTAALVAGFDLEDRGRSSVKGARHPLRVYELRGEGTMPTRLELSRQRGFTPFVGRIDLLAELDGALATTIGGTGQAINLVGEAGVGKSRLCHEFAERCRARGVRVFEVRPRVANARGPFDPVLQLLRTALDLPRDGRPEAIREHLATRLAALAEPATVSLPVLFELLGVPDPLHPLPRMDPEARRRHLQRVLVAVFAAIGADHPVVAVVEDVHAFDAASIGVLDHLIRLLRGMRVLLVLNRRPDGLARTTGGREVALEPLDADTTRQLVRALLGDHDSIAGLIDQIAAVAGGNPFFVEEIVRSLLAAHELKGRDGDYRASRPIDHLSLPATVHALLSARIDSLSEGDKTLLQAAAVIGREFRAELLQELLGSTKERLTRPLKRLCEAGFLDPAPMNGAPAFAFRQALLQEVAYRSQLTPKRQRLHARLAELIAAADDAAHVDSSSPRIAEHWEAAGRVDLAPRWHARAARWLGPNDPAEAYRHWRRVSEIVENASQTQDTLLLAWRARAQQVNLGWRLGAAENDIVADFTAAERLARTIASPEALAATYGVFGLARGMAGHLREANDSLTRATDALGDAASAGLRVALHLALAYAQMAGGRLRDALESAERALGWTESDVTLGRDRAGMSPRPLLLALRGVVLTQMGRLAEAGQDLDEALLLARELGEVEVEGFVLAWRVGLATVTGKSATVLDDASRALEAAEQTGSTFARVTALRSVGEAHALRGEWCEAASALAEALDLARERRAGLSHEAAILSVQAEAQLGLGEHREASRVAQEAVAVARHRGARVDECGAHLALARVMLASKRARHHQKAPKLLEEASRIIAETGANAFAPFVLAARAEFARRAEDEEAAARYTGEAARLFRAMGAHTRARRLTAKPS